ncbi:MAG: histidine phosphatase family protein [Acidimicrobiales bacterium]
MLLLVRHGQSRANAAGLLVGRADSPLTELGRRQADALGAALAPTITTGCRILASPLQRAAKTAQAIAATCKGSPAPSRVRPLDVRPGVITDARFIELDYGELDETAVSELPAGLWEHWREDLTWRPPGGETLWEVRARVSAACEELAAEAGRGDVIVVSHLSPIKAAVTWALGSGPELSWRMSLGVASITRIATDGARGPSLVSFNETAHLAGLA